MNVDKGFRAWAGRLFITHLRDSETAIIKAHREQRIRDEEDIRMKWSRIMFWTHLSGFGWALVRAFFWMFWLASSLLGFFIAVVLLAFFMALVSMASCQPNFAANQMSPFVEIRSKKLGHVLVSAELASTILLSLEVFRASMQSALEIVLGNRWHDYQNMVCTMVSASPLAKINWMGVWLV